LGQTVVVAEVKVDGAGDADVLVGLVDTAVLDALGGTGIAREVVTSGAVNADILAGQVSTAVSDILGGADLSGQIVTNGAVLTHVLVGSVDQAVRDGLEDTGGGVGREVVAAATGDAGVVGSRGNGAVGDVNPLAGVARKVVGRLAGGAQVSVRSVGRAIGDVLERALVETVNEVPGVANKALVLVQLVGVAVRERLRGTCAAGNVVADVADDAGVAVEGVDLTVADSAQAAGVLSVDVISWGADQALGRAGLGAGLAVGEGRALLSGGADEGKQ